MAITSKLTKVAAAILALATAAACAEKTLDLTLHYDRPAEYFEEALPLGNGRLGAMVYGGTAVDRISLNEATFWTGEPDKGAGHIDIRDSVGSEAAATIPLIREALDREDYAEADRLQRKVQGHYSESYQPIGNLRITYPESEISDYSRRLDISDAIAEVSYLRDGRPFKAEYFVSAPDPLVVIRLTSEAGINATLSFDSPQKHTITAEGNMISADGYAPYHSYPSYYRHDIFSDPARGTRFSTRIQVRQKSGNCQADGETLRLEGSTEALILVSIATSFNGFDKDPATEGRDNNALAEAAIRNASATSYAKLLKRHISDYRSYFDRLSLDLGTTADSIKALPTDVQLKLYTDEAQANPELEALYFQYGRYLLISSSRTEGVPANLQGLWNESMMPPWCSSYTSNINVEENYWPAETANLGDLQEIALLNYIDNVAVGGAYSAARYYGIDRGWCMSHNSDIWAMSSPVGLETGDPSWANWNMGGAWLSTHIWEHYLFSRDIESLRRHYPALKGAAEFCLDWLVEKDGELVTSPSTSPENFYLTDSGYRGATLYGATADLAIIRECLTDAVSAAEVLGDDPAFVEEAREKLARLHPYKVGADGSLQEWYHDWKDPEPWHRHQSHLIGLYPGHQITPEETPELAAACAKALEIKGFETTGWSSGWRVNLYARLGDSKGAYRMFRRLLKYVSPDWYRGPDARRGGGTYPNLFDAHSPFQIDGNFGGASGVLEMIAQSSEDGTIKELPALPDAWKDGSVKGMRLRNGKTLDMTWRDGKVVSKTIR